jgi:intracellular multiplication protein IcmB
MSFWQKFLAPFKASLKTSVESFIRLETADDEHTLVARDGSLISYIKVDGCRQMIGEDEYKTLVTSGTMKIGTRFDRAGHAMQIYFTRDPDRIAQDLERKVRPIRATARNIELEVQDLIDERVRHLSHYLTYEEFYFVLWTRGEAMTKSERDRLKQEKNNKKVKRWVRAPNAQNPTAALEPLRTRHASFISGMRSALDELGVRAELMDVHTALRAIRDNLYPSRSNENWRALLPGDPMPSQAPTSSVDMSEVLWLPLSAQLAIGDARVINDQIVQLGDMLWAGADMILGPMEASPFPALLNRLFEAKVPYRISFLVEGGGASSVALQSFLATMMGVTNASNKQIKYALEGLQKLARNEAVVKLRVSFATWARRDQMKLLLDRKSVLLQAVESWGYCQVSEASGDPLDCVMSSAMGIHCGGTAPSGVAPLQEVLKLIPWQRPSSPFATGALLFRTPDGKCWPYQTGTNMTTTWFDLIFAQPGAGKSVLMNSLNFGTVLTPGLSKLPFISIIDIGPSSSGLISLVKEALPVNRGHEAAYYRLQMSQQFAVNPFDSQLGCRYPLNDERSYLTELLTLLCTPPGAGKPYDGMQQLAGMVVDEMYRWRDDKAANAEPRPYLPRVDHDIDEGMQKYNIHLPSDPYWWDIVDKFFDIGQYQLAGLAQRYAAPVLGDSITASRRPQIRTLLDEVTTGTSAESLIGAFERMITSAVREYPILAAITQFEISDARICALDLMDVAPQGDATADRQTAIMYMLARYTLVRSWWMGLDALIQIPEKYRDYHELRLQDIGETPKRLSLDEFHRTSTSAAVRGQVVRDVREGRKRGVQIVLASQLLDDFDKDMVDLATGVWVLGTAVSDKAVDNVRDRFGLTQTARNVVRYRLTGPKASGAPALLVLGTTEGRYEQHLINTLGPIELWAFSTSAEDVAIRSRLYKKIGAGRARQLLAANFPGGSARNEIKRRVLMRADSGEAKAAASSAVIEDIVLELVAASEKKLDAAPGA